MNIELYKHQKDLVDSCKNSLKEFNAVLAVLPTGGGKSFCIAETIRKFRMTGTKIIFAHRDILVKQLSETLCLFKIKHSIYASDKTIKNIGDDPYINNSDNPSVVVASVDTFAARDKSGTLPAWVSKSCLAIVDEGHHIQIGNKWGRTIAALPESVKILGFTATPVRLDGQGLGRDSGGLFDKMIVGVDMKWLIGNGFLSPYRFIGLPESLAIYKESRKSSLTGNGDFSKKTAEKLTDMIYANVVDTYLRHGNKKQWITFSPSVDAAELIAEEFNKAGIPAKAVSSRTPDKERQESIKKFRDGKLLQLCNYQLFDEGFDVIGS